MAFRKVITASLIFLGVDLLLIGLLPAARLLVDPLLLLLIVLSPGMRTSRSLWGLGASLGLLKDLYAGSVFGAWICAFAAAAWLIGATRRMIAWEDPAVVGIWATILTLFVWLVYGLWLTVADPFVHWGNGQMLAVPASMITQGLLAAWIFPRVQKRFGAPAPSYRF